jgi:hypothetical protein
MLSSRSALRIAPVFEQQAAELRHAVDAGKGDLGCVQALQPRFEVSRVGQRREEQFFILALILFVAERGRHRQRAAKKLLADLAGDQCCAVGAAQEGDGFMGMPFFGNIDQQRKTILCAGAR